MNWIKCSDRLPNDWQSVIMYFGDNVLHGQWVPDYGGYFRVPDIEWNGPEPSEENPVTHWMPLPTAPKDEK